MGRTRRGDVHLRQGESAEVEVLDECGQAQSGVEGALTARAIDETAFLPRQLRSSRERRIWAGEDAQMWAEAEEESDGAACREREGE